MIVKHLKRFNEEIDNLQEEDSSLEKLVKQILDAAKLDVDAIEESDPDFIPYIADMIKDDILKKFALFVTEMENDRANKNVQEDLAQELLDRFLKTKK